MKRKTAKTPATARKAMKQPGPAWINDELKPTFEKMTPAERLLRAELMELQAAQLREMKPAPCPCAGRVEVPLLPNMKKALLSFAQSHGARPELDEKSRLETGARWFLENALPFIAVISQETNRRAAYRDAEGLDDTDFTERLIGAALKKY